MVCKYCSILDCKKEHKYQSEPITEAKGVIILWDLAIQNDRKIKRNRLDIVVKDYKSNSYLLIDMVIPTDNNISVKEYYKISKYKDLKI